jgi:hypothetical protein
LPRPGNLVGVLAISATLIAGAVTSLPANAATKGPIGQQSGPAGPPGPGGPPAERSCISPDGTNLNQFFGIRQRIIGPPACREAFAGEWWVRAVPSWITAAGPNGAVYPAGYIPANPNPIDDFNSKFVGATYIQDRGTAQERTFVFGRRVLRTGFVGADGLPFSAFVSPPFRPLRIGQHTSTVFLTLSAEHCDGLGVDRDANCLPEGTFLYSEVPFQVSPRRHSKPWPVVEAYGVPVGTPSLLAAMRGERAMP